MAAERHKRRSSKRPRSDDEDPSVNMRLTRAEKREKKRKFLKDDGPSEKTLELQAQKKEEKQKNLDSQDKVLSKKMLVEKKDQSEKNSESQVEGPSEETLELRTQNEEEGEKRKFQDEDLSGKTRKQKKELRKKNLESQGEGPSEGTLELQGQNEEEGKKRRSQGKDLSGKTRKQKKEERATKGKFRKNGPSEKTLELRAQKNMEREKKRKSMKDEVPSGNTLEPRVQKDEQSEKNLESRNEGILKKTRAQKKEEAAKKTKSADDGPSKKTLEIRALKRNIKEKRRKSLDEGILEKTRAQKKEEAGKKTKSADDGPSRKTLEIRALKRNIKENRRKSLDEGILEKTRAQKKEETGKKTKSADDGPSKKTPEIRALKRELKEERRKSLNEGILEKTRVEKKEETGKKTKSADDGPSKKTPEIRALKRELKEERRKSLNEGILEKTRVEKKEETGKKTKSADDGPSKKTPEIRALKPEIKEERRKSLNEGILGKTRARKKKKAGKKTKSVDDDPSKKTPEIRVLKPEMMKEWQKSLNEGIVEKTRAQKKEETGKKTKSADDGPSEKTLDIRALKLEMMKKLRESRNEAILEKARAQKEEETAKKCNSLKEGVHLEKTPKYQNEGPSEETRVQTKEERSKKDKPEQKKGPPRKRLELGAQRQEKKCKLQEEGSSKKSRVQWNEEMKKTASMRSGPSEMILEVKARKNEGKEKKRKSRELLGTPPSRKKLRTGPEAPPLPNTIKINAPEIPPEALSLPDTTKVDVLKLWFLKWEISSISTIAVSPNGRFMVVARKSGCLELRPKCFDWETTFIVRWNVSNETSAVSALAFDNTSNYLVVGRLNGHLDIYSVSDQGMAHHVRVEPGGGSVFSLATRPYGDFEVAVGSEDGRVRFVRVDEEFATLNTRKEQDNQLPTDMNHYLVHRGPRSDGMCLSLDWKSNGPEDAGSIVCGDSVAGLRWISGSTKEIVGRSHAPIQGSKCQIWTVQIVANGTQVVCGDSRGMVTVWCCRTFTKVEENQIEGMAGDIWSSAVIEESSGVETVLLGCAGGTVASITSLVSANGSVSWMPRRATTIHSHDVRSICVIPKECFITGSYDTRLCIITGPTTDQANLNYILPYHGAAGQNPTQVIREASLIVSMKQSEIDFWSPSVSAREDPFLALRIKRPDSVGSTVSLAAANDASSIAVSNVEGFSIYDLTKSSVVPGKNSPLFSKVVLREIASSVEKSFKGANQLSILKGSVIGIPRDMQSLLILTGDKLQCISREEIGSKALFLTKLLCNPESGSIVVADSLGDIFLADIDQLEEKGFRYVASVGPEKRIACMECSSNGQTLGLSLTDRTIAVIPLKEEKPSIGITKPFQSLIKSMSFSSKENSVLLSGSRFCCVARWRGNQRTGGHVSDLHVQTTSLLRKTVILASGILSPSLLCIIERKFDTEFSRLPAVVPRRTYGL